MGLPKNVHKVTARAREYFYYQEGRGTEHEGPRVSLGTDPHSPEFWAALRRAQGAAATAPVVKTIDMVCDLYFDWEPFKELAAGTQKQYRQVARVVREAWGSLPAEGVRPVHVQELMDGLVKQPGKANNVLGFLWALNKWGRARDHFPHSITEGVEAYDTGDGHKPWTDAQCAAAEAALTGMIRRAYFLARYTGQRGSDIIRLGETFLDDGGFRLRQRKTGKKVGDIWCPIEEPLAREMATWERAPGPYLRSPTGLPLDRRALNRLFTDARDAIEALSGSTFHGLRGTRVIELRQRGATTLQIQDQVGMSPKMIERYCRFADRKANGKAAVVALAELAEQRKNRKL